MMFELKRVQGAGLCHVRLAVQGLGEKRSRNRTLKKLLVYCRFGEQLRMCSQFAPDLPQHASVSSSPEDLRVLFEALRMQA